MSAVSKHGLPFTYAFSKPIPWGKRTFDIFAGLSLLVLLAPVFLLIALTILVVDGSPIFYNQERLGLCGKPFTMYKFRTMQQDAERETGPTWASVGDVRITRVGALLRRTRLDELPQLFNVVWGDMSMVGPRPERGIFAETFSQEIPAFSLRLHVKPGITGLAQVSGGYDLSPLCKLKYDLVYIRTMSWKVDLQILWATLFVMLSGLGAR